MTMFGMTCQPHSIVAIPFPFSDLKATKRRPVLVVTPPDRHGDFIGLAVTSVFTPETSISINSISMGSGRIPKPSWVRCDKIFTLRQKDIVGIYGSLNENVFFDVLKEMCDHLGCRIVRPSL